MSHHNSKAHWVFLQWLGKSFPQFEWANEFTAANLAAVNKCCLVHLIAQQLSGILAKINSEAFEEWLESHEYCFLPTYYYVLG